MSSIPGLPMQGSDVTAVITRVHLHPLCVLVEFWAKFSQQSKADYQRLASNIQSPGAPFRELEGNPGDQCLVQIHDTWHRSRIVSRDGFNYQVFLIDKGMICSATTSMLAWGKKEYFQVPPEVEFCVLANVLPRAQEKRWSPMAQEYLKSYTGKSVAAHVQDVLVSHKIFLLHIPSISTQMYEMGFAMKLSPAMFLDFVQKTLKSPSGGDAPLEAMQLFEEASNGRQKQELFVYPELSVENTMAVTVTEVISPKKIFCQLKIFSKELKRLSRKLAQSFEIKNVYCILCPEMIGCPFAAKGNDGQWYRCVVQQLFPTNALVKVLNVDYGTKQFVSVENIRELPAEFFRMPVFTYCCSLHGITDESSGWEAGQINFLRSLLLHKTVSAHFEYHIISEGVYSVTLYGDHNTNLNTLFGSREGCLLEGEKAVARYSIQSARSTKQHLTPETDILLYKQVPRERGDECLLLENLPLNSSHLAVVHHIISPSEFWIQMETYRKELDKLLDNIYHLHKGSVNTDVKDPAVGLYCVAKAKDHIFYRASVCEVGDAKVKVYFVDYGNTEVVDKNDIRSLPPELKELPHLALKCSLASVGPTDGRWNDSATEFFTKVVMDKLLDIKVKAKNADGYAVQLSDPNAQSEQDVGTLMCNFSHAEWLESIQPSVVMPPAHVNGHLPACNGDKVEPKTKGGFVIKEAPIFKGRMFSTGSVLEVNVSNIESPNDFWCQLVQNMKHLHSLMSDLQSHYANSEFQNDAETSCVAQHPSNGMWYRALVVRMHKTPHVDVLFVDYGHMETVSISALRRIRPEFLTLHGQAFRCSLLNLMDPTSLVNNWKEEAKAKFLNFVKTAASNFGILKCTVYAVMYNDQRTLYNVVDLETPFESICTIMANLVLSPPPQKPNSQSACLCTYYYSAHDIKVGTEEQVTVTCVNSVNHFYCHLDKNQDVIEELSTKLNSLCHQLLKVKFPKVFASLCFAKYTDGQWYRAQIKKTKPALLVQFVDYGDTIEVDKSDLIPIPKEANDILSMPIQAVLCGLADVPPDVSSEANQWFITAVADCKFKARVVAKEPHGKLLVELYHGNSQINFDIKNMFLKAQKKQQSHEDFQPPGDQTLSTARVFSEQAVSKSSFSVSVGVLGRNRSSVNLKSSKKTENGSCDSMKKMRRVASELYKPPHQRNSSNTKPDTANKTADVSGNQRVDYLSPETKFVLSESSRTESQQEKGPQFPELPPSRIAAGMTLDVYVSHYNSPLSFYVQLVDEEEELFSLVEQLNDPERTQKDSPIQDVRVGDLVLAEFSEDSSWYRAVVTEIQEEHTALIEFVDFGNTAETPVSNMRRLHQSFLQLPAYSTHCMLGDAGGLGLRMLDPEVVSLFKEDIGVCGEKVLRCCFIKEAGSVWEVSLEDDGVAVVCKVPGVDAEEQEEEEPTRGGQKNLLSVDAPEIVLNGSVKKTCFSESATKKDGGFSWAPLTAGEAIQLTDESSQCSCVEDSPPADIGTESSRTESQQEKGPQLPELPPSRITAGMTLDVYVSHYSSPLSFYVQRVDEEEELFSLVEQLNDPERTQKDSPIQDVHVGDLVLAEFSEDSSWYRAVVTEIQEEHTALIEFVDFGNTAETPVSNMRRLHQSFLQLPAYSTHCMLGDAGGLGLRMLDPEVVSLFKEDIGVGGEKVLRCCFIKEAGSVWEVSLEDDGVAVVCKVPGVDAEEQEGEEPTNISAFTHEAEISEKSPISVSSPHKEQELIQEQQLEEFIPTTNEKISKTGDSGVEERATQSGGKSPPPADESESFDFSPEVINEPETKTSEIEEKEASICSLEIKNFSELSLEKNEDERIASIPPLTASRAVHMISRKADLKTSDPDVPKQLLSDSGVEEKSAQTEEKSPPPVEAPESETPDLSLENLREDIDEPETRLEEKEAPTCSSEMKSFSEPGGEKHEQEDSEWTSFGAISRTVQVDDESNEVSTCVEESCPADVSADLKNESPDEKTQQGSVNLSAGAEEVTSAVSFSYEDVEPEVKGGEDSVHQDKQEKKENCSGSSVEHEEVSHPDDASSLSVEDIFTSQENSICGDECSDCQQTSVEADEDLFPSPDEQKQESGAKDHPDISAPKKSPEDSCVQLSLTSLCIQDVPSEVLPAEKLPEK